MKLKYRPEDFIVREQPLDLDLKTEGPLGVYRLRKKKKTTLEVLATLARIFSVDRQEIGYAGLKDRQSVSEQIISIPGPSRELDEDDFSLEPLGRTNDPVTSAINEQNRFTIVVRDILPPNLRALERNLPIVQSNGLPNYFDDQRFACLRFGQGFIAKELIRGEFELALRKLIAVEYPNDNRDERTTKAFIRRFWGQWDVLAAKMGE